MPPPRLALSLLLLLLLLLPGALAAAAPAQVGGVLAEGRAYALGLSTLSPRFSWQLLPDSAERNVSQTAYSIAVLPSAAPGAQPLWASGVVADSRCTHAPGPPAGILSPGGAYYVEIRAWYSSASGGGAAAPSAPLRFSVGLLGAADWEASTAFVGLPAGGPPGAAAAACPWLRTTFSLSAAEVAGLAQGSALLHVASIGYHEASINGALLSLSPRAGAASVLAPPISDLGRRVSSVTYDAAPALRAGANVLALWLAPGWSAFEGVNPVMSFNVTNRTIAAAELRLRPAGLKPRTVATNGSWAARASTTRHLGAWTNSNFGGDIIDWALDLPGWNTAAVDDGAWARAAALPFPAGLAITPSDSPSNAVARRLPAARVDACGAGCWRVTMAELFTGWLLVRDSLPLPGPAFVNISS